MFHLNYKLEHTIYLLIEVHCARVQGLGCPSIDFKKKTCCPVPTIRIYTVNMNHVDLYIQGSADLRMCRSQMDSKIARILVFLDDLWMIHQAFGVNLLWYVCCY